MYLSVAALIIVFHASPISCHIDSLPNGIHYVGCFTTAFSRQNDKGANISPMTWEVCIRLCLEKDSRYAGVESRKSMCYCGNNLAHQSVKVAPYTCDEECFADNTKICGGSDDLLSLYQIKNNSSFSFLVTTDNGLAYFKNGRLTPNFVTLPRISNIKAVYHYAENTIYFHSEKKIFKSRYVPLLREHWGHTELVELKDEASSLALDWISSQLFWALPNSIVQSYLDGSNRRVIVSTKHPALDLTVDPYQKKLFFIINGTIKRYDLKSNKIGNNNLFKYNRFNVVTNLAVDLHKQIVYAIGYYEQTKDGEKHLVSTDYEGVMFRVLLRRRQLNGAFSLSALNDQLFWAEFKGGHERTLYYLKVPVNSVLPTPKKLSSLPQNVVGAVLYHEDSQTTGESYFCQKIKCSHICTYTLENSAKCGCPQLMTLKKDHRTCKDIPGLKRLKGDNSDESNEFDDEIFNVSIDFPREGKSRKKSRNKKTRSRKGEKLSKHKKSRKGSSDSEVKSRSFPFTTLLNSTNIGSNVTVI